MVKLKDSWCFVQAVRVQLTEGFMFFSQFLVSIDQAAVHSCTLIAMLKLEINFAHSLLLYGNFGLIGAKKVLNSKTP